MKILIKNIKGEIFEIDCGLQETILDAKQKILAAKKLDPEVQKLIFKGTVTSNEKTLQEYGLKENDFMVLLTTKKLNKPIEKKEEISLLKHEEINSKPSTDTTPASNGLVFGSALDQAIDSMVNMGFPKNYVIQALHAAYHNPDKALDYLFNGIPDLYMMEQELNTNLNENIRHVNEDELAIDRLSSLGFAKEAASSAFYASGKNENYAANILLFNQTNVEEENQNNDDNEPLEDNNF